MKDVPKLAFEGGLESDEGCWIEVAFEGGQESIEGCSCLGRKTLIFLAFTLFLPLYSHAIQYGCNSVGFIF